MNFYITHAVHTAKQNFCITFRFLFVKRSFALLANRVYIIYILYIYIYIYIYIIKSAEKC